MTKPKKRYRRLTPCPICGGRVSVWLIDWHLQKYHDPGRAIVLEEEQQS